MIGAAKCGSSSLHYYLGLHPEIQMSVPKELNFFIDEDGFDPAPYVDDERERRLFGERRTWRRGEDWYRSHFSPRVAIRGETSVPYSFPWYSGVADRMAALVPDARIIYLVRDPVDRMVSHYLQYRGPGRERRPLAEALASPTGPYLGASAYATVIGRFLECFPPERVMILRQERLFRSRRETMAEVFRFLEVEEDFWSERIGIRRNRSDMHGRIYRAADRVRRSRPGIALRERLPARIRMRIEQAVTTSVSTSRPEVGPGLRKTIVERLEPEIAGLESLTGWDLAAWRRTEAATGES